MSDAETQIAIYQMSSWVEYWRYELFPTSIRIQGGWRNGNQYDVTVLLANLQPKFNVLRYPSPFVRAGTVLLGLILFVFVLMAFGLKRPWSSTEMIASEVLIAAILLTMLMNWNYRCCYSFVYHSGIQGVNIFQHGRDGESCEQFARLVQQQIQAQQ